MSGIYFFSTSGFRAISATPNPLSLRQLLVEFSAQPKASSSSDPTDSLYPNNYTVQSSSGTPISVISVAVTASPYKVMLTLASPFTNGDWQVTVQNVQSLSAVTVTTTTIPFTVAISGNSLGIQGTAVAGAEAIHLANSSYNQALLALRNNLSPAIKGPNTQNLLSALATGIAQLFDTANESYNQAYWPTATDVWLDMHAANYGVYRPENIGPNDELLRGIIDTKNDQLTLMSLYEAMKSFYGADAVHARIMAGNYEPYRITQGEKLSLQIDGKYEVTVAFSNLAVNLAATAQEVASALNDRFYAEQIQAEAFVDSSASGNRVGVRSLTFGTASKVKCLGGLAQNSLMFPLTILRSVQGTSYQIVAGSEPYLYLSSASVLFDVVRVGDIVTIKSDNVSSNNEGSFEVTGIDTRYVSGAFQQKIYFTNPDASNQTFTALSISDWIVFRPTQNILSSDSSTVEIDDSDPSETTLLIPAVSGVVERTLSTAAYVNAGEEYIVTAKKYGNYTNFDFGTTPPLAINSFLQFIDFIPSNVKPTVTASGTSGGNYLAQVSPIHNTTTLSSVSLSGSTYVAAVTSDSSIVLGDSAAKLLTVVARNTITTGDSTNLKQVEYSITNKTARPVNLAYSSFTHTGEEAGRLLIAAGGYVAASGVVATTHSYNPATDTWTAITNAVTRARHAALTMDSPSGPATVLVDGLKNASQAQSNIQTVLGVATTVFSAGDRGRFDHAAVAISDTVFVVGGRIGKSTAPSGLTLEVPDLPVAGSDNDVLATGYSIQPFAVSPTKTSLGLLSYARSKPAIISKDGKVWVIGGYGRNLSNETSNRYLSECEVLVNNRWQPMAKLNVARYGALAVEINNTIYVIGGQDSSGNVSTVEYYNEKLRQWEILATNTNPTSPVYGTAVSWSQGELLLVGSNVQLFIYGCFQVGSLKNDFSTISTVGSNSVNISNTNSKIWANGTATVYGGLPSSNSSIDYLGDTMANGVTSTTVSLNQNLIKGLSYGTINVSGEVPSSGFFTVDFGNSELIAIQYNSVDADNNLILTKPFFPTRSYETGDAINILGNPASIAATATANTAGQTAALQTIEAIRPQGHALNVNLKYPADAGLGNAGSPVEGSVKLSDVVLVYADGDGYSFLEKARGGL